MRVADLGGGDSHFLLRYPKTHNYDIEKSEFSWWLHFFFLSFGTKL